MGEEKKAVKEKRLVNVEGNTPADMIRMAVAGKADLEKLEKLLSLQERWDANEARKAYHKAMAEFKANPPKIDKDKSVSYAAGSGKVAYNHASLYNVTEKISAELSKHGLSASWTTKQNGAVLVTCKITHVNGHSEETTLAAPADSSGSKNSIQAIGSTITYLCRYTLLCLTGLATYGQDDDGRAVTAEFIGEKEVKIINDGLAELNIPREKFLAYVGVTKVEEITKADLKKAKAAIEAKRKAGKSENN